MLLGILHTSVEEPRSKKYTKTRPHHSRSSRVNAFSPTRPRCRFSNRTKLIRNELNLKHKNFLILIRSGRRFVFMLRTDGSVAGAFQMLEMNERIVEIILWHWHKHTSVNVCRGRGSKERRECCRRADMNLPPSSACHTEHRPFVNASFFRRIPLFAPRFSCTIYICWICWATGALHCCATSNLAYAVRRSVEWVWRSMPPVTSSRSHKIHNFFSSFSVAFCLTLYRCWRDAFFSAILFGIFFLFERWREENQR